MFGKIIENTSKKIKYKSDKEFCKEIKKLVERILKLNLIVQIIKFLFSIILGDFGIYYIYSNNLTYLKSNIINRNYS